MPPVFWLRSWQGRLVEARRTLMSIHYVFESLVPHFSRHPRSCFTRHRCTGKRAGEGFFVFFGCCFLLVVWWCSGGALVCRCSGPPFSAPPQPHSPCFRRPILFRTGRTLFQTFNLYTLDQFLCFCANRGLMPASCCCTLVAKAVEAATQNACLSSRVLGCSLSYS